MCGRCGYKRPCGRILQREIAVDITSLSSDCETVSVVFIPREGNPFEGISGENRLIEAPGNTVSIASRPWTGGGGVGGGQNPTPLRGGADSRVVVMWCNEYNVLFITFNHVLLPTFNHVVLPLTTYSITFKLP